MDYLATMHKMNIAGTGYGKLSDLQIDFDSFHLAINKQSAES